MGRLDIRGVGGSTVCAKIGVFFFTGSLVQNGQSGEGNFLRFRVWGSGIKGLG